MYAMIESLRSALFLFSAMTSIAMALTNLISISK